MSPAVQALFASWSIPPWTTFAILLTAVVYVRGWVRLGRLHSSLLPRWRLACFLSGLASLWLAIASPLDAFDAFLLTAHMVQHLLLILVAPPLVLLGSPAIPLLRGLPRWAARDALGPFLRWPWLGRAGRALTHPTFCWLTAALALIGWHVPAAYDLALRSLGWHEMEHACFFGSSVLFWWPVIQPWPSSPQWPRWLVPVYLLLGGIVNTVIGAFLCFSGRLLYPAYATVPRLFGLSAMNDQVAAGALMWAFGSFVFLGAGTLVTFQLLSPAPANLEPIPQNALWAAAEPHRARGRFDLLEVPLLGAFLRARHGRRILQGILLTLALAVVADGFLGPSMAPMNLAGVLPWTYARAFAVIALLAAGNFFCMACPFTLPRELARRLGLATRNWPYWLRSKWLAAALLAGFFWAYEAFSLWNSPIATAGIVAAYFLGAFAVDTFFRGASFCKYVCPIGQFSFVASVVSPLEVRVRRREVCTACATHDCFRGNERQRGCELHLYLPQKSGNMDCTFCLDCVKACPHDNIGILALAPAHDLARDPKRSSVGRFRDRLDVAALTLVMVFGGFAAAVAMVSPFTAWREHWVERLHLVSAFPLTSLFFLAALIIAPPILVGGSAAAGRWMARIQLSLRELFCCFAVALVPLGLAMWVSHLLFHLSTGWRTAWPALDQAGADLGVSWLGHPHWAMSHPLLGAGTLLDAQLLILDAGLILTLYAGWRAAQAFAPRGSAALRLVAPWAIAAWALYASGVWILLQPMQMRGMMR
jgi:cytochrome c oxidase assembly factor CtaG/ferredoxin